MGQVQKDMGEQILRRTQVLIWRRNARPSSILRRRLFNQLFTVGG
jgi:hypothetical protein